MSLNNKNILITGGTGSFGSKFVKQVLKKYKPRKLVIFSRDEQKQYEMSQILSERKWYEVEGEVSIHGEIKISLTELKHLKRRFNSKVETPSAITCEVNAYLLTAAMNIQDNNI